MHNNTLNKYPTNQTTWSFTNGENKSLNLEVLDHSKPTTGTISIEFFETLNFNDTVGINMDNFSLNGSEINFRKGEIFSSNQLSFKLSSFISTVIIGWNPPNPFPFTPLVLSMFLVSLISIIFKRLSTRKV
jgi:hypothetical protein